MAVREGQILKYFCILTTGRSGSTSLINALAAQSDIITLDKLTESPDNELLHPEWVSRYVQHFQPDYEQKIATELQLIDAFFNAASKQQGNFAGFKSMPNRHRQLAALIQHPKIQIITLVRNDLASTVASFLMAMQKGTWRRDGEIQNNRLVFTDNMQQQAFGNLQYIVNAEHTLKNIKNAIHLQFEDLCDNKFTHPALDRFFQRPVRLISPKKPVSAQTYVENWTQFKNFVDVQAKRIQRQLK